MSKHGDGGSFLIEAVLRAAMEWRRALEALDAAADDVTDLRLSNAERGLQAAVLRYEAHRPPPVVRGRLMTRRLYHVAYHYTTAETSGFGRVALRYENVAVSPAVLNDWGRAIRESCPPDDPAMDTVVILSWQPLDEDPPPPTEGDER